MRHIGTAYTVNLGSTPVLLVWRSGMSTGAVIQPQDVDLCYRLDGVVENLNGFILPNLQQATIRVDDTGLVVWAARQKGRLVIQEFTD